MSGTPEATRVEVRPNATYQLAEFRNTDEHDYLHYLQNDLRTRPLYFPESTGSWNCAAVQADGTTGGQSPFGTEGAIIVPLGMEYICTATNETGFLTVEKEVHGGTAAPGDFIFHVEPLDPVIPGGHSHDFAAGQEQTIRPTQRYRLTEVDGPPGYRLAGLTCTGGGTTFDPDDFFVNPSGRIRCTAVNHALSALTVQKVDASSDAQLGGATFDLVRDSDGDGAYDPGTDTVIGTCTTATSTGSCSIDQLGFGTYYWVETEPPPATSCPPRRSAHRSCSTPATPAPTSSPPSYETPSV